MATQCGVVKCFCLTIKGSLVRTLVSVFMFSLYVFIGFVWIFFEWRILNIVHFAVNVSVNGFMLSRIFFFTDVHKPTRFKLILEVDQSEPDREKNLKVLVYYWVCTGHSSVVMSYYQNSNSMEWWKILRKKKNNNKWNCSIESQGSTSGLWLANLCSTNCSLTTVILTANYE